VGLRDLRSRLFRWRVGVRWYAVALLTAPLLMMAIQAALSLTSTAFLPAVITADNKASLLVALVAGLVAGLVAAFFEEIFWTGFATHELRKRHGLLATGLLVGLPWCLLHLQLVAGTSSGAVPPALYVAVVLFAWQLPYRVLMVLVYDHTQSVLMAMLMHLPIVVCLFVLSPAVAGVSDLIIDLVFGATLWVVVAAVVAVDRRKLSRGGHTPATPSSAGPARISNLIAQRPP
jgi:membrane protease YdiL (CAAX protease family)